MDTSRFIPGDKTLILNIVEYLKAKGIFDEYRHECLADVDTKSSCQNLSQRIDGYTAKFLANETWHPDLNKNELRNKLRRHIDESGMLAVGADHVVEQVINPKITQLFLPSIFNVVHQYIREETENLNAKQDTVSEEDKYVAETLEEKTTKTVSDPIADILAFSYSKSKQANQSTTIIKTESSQLKTSDVSLKIDKKKEDKSQSIKAEPIDTHIENAVSASIELKAQSDNKDIVKIKKEFKLEDSEIHTETQKKVQKGDSKPEKKKLDEIKQESTDSGPVAEENVTNKLTSSSVPVKSHSSSKNKSDVDKRKLKVKSQNLQKTSGDVRKGKSKEISDSPKPSSEKHIKSATKINKTPTKDPSSPFKSGSSKSSKDDKMGESCVKSKTFDSSIVKTLSSKINKKENIVSKHLAISGKDEKIKNLKFSVQKSDLGIGVDDSSSCEKGNKSHVQYSSSHESSQGSDQDKSSKSINPKVRKKLFSKHIKKEPDEKSDSDHNKKVDKRQQVKGFETIKKYKGEKTSKSSSAAEKQKEVMSQDAAKISSRSNSLGSSSSASSSSNASKDNLSNSDNAESSAKSTDKKKKQALKEKDRCRSPQTFPPPPPPPSSGACETQSSAEVSSIEDTQSSQGTDDTGDETSDKSFSESDSDESEQCSDNSNILNIETMHAEVQDDLDAFYDIFLYSSSSSEFEGYCSSPEKQNSFKVNLESSDIGVSSVHTSDLSSFDDELSDDEDSCTEDNQKLEKVKKKMTIREAQEFLRRKADQQPTHTNKESASEEKVQEKSVSNTIQRYISSDEELNSTYEPKRELRRERKINPKYASSEYTSIFNSKKESFITKQSSKASCQTANSTPEIETNERKKELQLQVGKPKLVAKMKIQTITSAEGEHTKSLNNKPETEKTKSVKENTAKLKDVTEIQGSVNHSSLSNSDNKCRIALQVKKSENKCNAQNRLDTNSHSVKRKLSSGRDSPPSVKRPCSRSSIDSCSSEFSVNENKPFNSEKDGLSVSMDVEQKNHKTHSSLKNSSDITKNLKKELFSQQNNGDILAKVDHVKKNVQSKSHSTAEKNKNESDLNSELTAV